jgi:hypothetical protein
MRPQELILGDSSYPIYSPMTGPTQGLSFANGNNTNKHGWGQGESPVIQPLDSVDMDNPSLYIKDKRVDLHMYQLQDHMKGKMT